MFMPFNSFNHMDCSHIKIRVDFAKTDFDLGAKETSW